MKTTFPIIMKFIKWSFFNTVKYLPVRQVLLTQKRGCIISFSLICSSFRVFYLFYCNFLALASADIWNSRNFFLQNKIFNFKFKRLWLLPIITFVKRSPKSVSQLNTNILWNRSPTVVFNIYAAVMHLFPKL